MRRTAVALSIALLSLTVACGDDEEEPADTAAPPAESAAAEPPAAGEKKVLNAVVGEEGKPDAFAIALTDDSGAKVTSLPAGDYEIRVDDPSTIHNFHLTGGGVEESTTVPETGEKVWNVTLAAGEYTYKCDPHPPMKGSFTVT